MLGRLYGGRAGFVQDRMSGYTYCLAVDTWKGSRECLCSVIRALALRVQFSDMNKMIVIKSESGPSPKGQFENTGSLSHRKKQTRVFVGSFCGVATWQSLESRKCNMPSRGVGATLKKKKLELV